MRVEIDKKAQKDFKNINRADHAAIKVALLALYDFPNIPNIKKLSNFEPGYRLRVGHYRILFDAQEDLVIVYRIRHRKDAYDQ
ncbi:MAG: type II toxin-antitoxin system RelE/ParE family toxin [Campylobacterales bacterium]|nr:type II toxin-antitoxin system RelE/ParE family toxin [Campylobacterales bacterium]